MEAKELRIGNYVDLCGISKISELHSEEKQFDNVYLEFEESFEWTEYNKLKPIPLTEEILLKCGFSIVNENSAGKKYSYVIDGIFSQDFNLVLWKTTKNFGKIYRGNLEIKYLHQLQNLYFALTNEELTVNL